MPGSYGAPQKKSGGAVIGIIVGVVVLLAIVGGIILGASGGKELAATDQALVDRLLTFSNANRVLFEPEELKRLEVLVNDGLIAPGQAELARGRLSQARTHRADTILIASAAKYTDLQKRARENALRVANEFYAAMKDGNVEALKGLINWDTYSQALNNQGMMKKFYSNKDGAAYNSPSSHELELVHDPEKAYGKRYSARVVRQFSTPELQTRGLTYLLSMYKKPDLVYEFETHEGLPTIYNLPPGLEGISVKNGEPVSDAVSDYWWAGIHLRFPKESKNLANKSGPLRVAIGDRWDGSSPKVVAIADRTAALWLEEKWNEVKAQEEIGGGGGDRHGRSLDDPDGTGAEATAASNIPAPTPYTNGTPAVTNVRPAATTSLDLFVDMAFKGSSVGKDGIEAFDAPTVTDADRLKMIAYASDKILQAMNQGQPRVAQCIQQIAEYVTECIKEWPALKDHPSWKNSISYVRPEQSLDSAKEIAFQYQQFYKTFKDILK